jgi:N-acetylmuramoyl-L-alanine amidase
VSSTIHKPRKTRDRQKGLAILGSFGLWFATIVAIGILWPATSGFAAARHPELARKAYERAMELQKKLQAEPVRSRKAADYERVIREFRNVYYYDFAYVKAPVAAKAMGDLYAEMGRQFSEPGYYQAAIKSYQYVISQYPGSSMAIDAELAVGKVYLKGLDERSQAADAFHAFLEKYPSSPQALEARKLLKEMAEKEAVEKQSASESARAGSSETKPGNPKSGPVEVTEIHNWVGPNYTRVVIGANGPFKYNTLRLSNPDRIVFDLPNTRATRALLKKSVPINGAFLRDIRVGQFKPDVTRIVLDVKNINDYSAFPLPNPFRLIIDVHGTATMAAKGNQKEQASVATAAEEMHREVQASAEEKARFERPAASVTPRPGIGSSARLAESTPPGTESISEPHAQAVKAESVVSSGHSEKMETESHAEAAATSRKIETVRPKESASISPHPGETEKTKTEIASGRSIPSPKKRKAEVALNDTEREEVPISTKPASPIGDGSQTLTRALGLKVARIVIDPGHGGFDTGTIGPTGLEEKNVVLDVALRLRKLFETRTDSEVFMTRSTDTFVPLEERTAIANEDGADLFISIHANASSDREVRGIETYFLNFTSDPDALQLAARENATSQESVHQLQSLIKKIALNNKIEESQELARDIQTALYKRMSRISRGVHNRGVRKAPFVVLIGANMPSVLTEISFLSNPQSEHLLRQPEYREQIAKALFNGIEDYISNLGSIRVAQRTH